MNIDKDIDSHMPKSMEELLERIYRDWTALMAFVEKLGESQMIYSKQGEWSIKDNLTHLEAWEKFLLLHHLNGKPPAEVLDIDWDNLRQLNEDQINAILWERHKSRNLTDLIDGMKATHAQVVAALEKVDFEELKKTDVVESLITRPILESVVCNTYEHYQEHLMTMYRMVELEGKA